MIVLLGLVLWGGEYVRRDLWAPDEARFALVSKEMREGHWLVPFRQGEFYSHKPPLMFWLTNVFSIVTGGEIGNVAPRFPSFLGALMALWAISRLAALWFSNRVGWYTVLVLSTSFLFWNKGGFGQIDMLLCGLEMMALYFLFTGSNARYWRTILAYSFMGLAVLAKGPVGFLVPWGVYFSTVWFIDKKSSAPRYHWLWGPLVTLLFPGIWLLLVWWQGAPDGYFNELLLKQNVGRVAGEFGGHVRPFYYFFYYFPLDFLPWTLLLPLSIAVIKRMPDREAGFRRLVVWILFVVLFFTLSSSKRNLYILLAYPAAAMLVAAAMDGWGRASLRMLSATFWSVWTLSLVLASGMLIAWLIPSVPFDARFCIPGGLFMAAGLWLSKRLWSAEPRNPTWLMACIGSIFLTYASTGALVYPALDDLKTPDEIITKCQSNLTPDERIIMYKMHGEIYSLYAERKGYMAFSDEDVVTFLTTSSQTNHIIMGLKSNWPGVQAIIGDGFEPLWFNSGSKRVFAVLLTGPLALNHDVDGAEQGSVMEKAAPPYD